MTYQWTENTKPDRPGIWAFKTSVNRWVPEHCTAENLHIWGDGTWAFLMDLPDIKDPPRYRDVTAADVGRLCEFSDDQKSWGDAYFVGIKREGNFRFVSEGIEDLLTWKFARILDDGQPKPTPSAEFWLNVYEDYCHMHPSQAEADAKAYKHRRECFKVRRVE